MRASTILRGGAIFIGLTAAGYGIAVAALSHFQVLPGAPINTMYEIYAPVGGGLVAALIAFLSGLKTPEEVASIAKIPEEIRHDVPGSSVPWATVNETSTGIAIHCPRCDAYQPTFGGLTIAAGLAHATHVCVQCGKAFQT